MSRDIRTTTLDNGMRVITDRVATVESIALGVWANVGSRHEDAAVNGSAHMVEHMLFKGTKNRNAQDIVDAIENVGGQMNAYTSREITSYHIHLLKDDADLALDVLSDMYQNSTLPEDELSKERHVILQEIGMCNDTPDDLIFDHFYETAYADQAAGRPILGPSDIVSAMPRDALNTHIQSYYTPQNTVLAASGNLDHDDFCRRADAHFSAMPNSKDAPYEAATYTGGERRDSKTDLEQTHVLIGFDSVSRHDPDFYAVRAMTSILGGGMSSRLFQEVREKRGLVYSVFAFSQAMQDSGLFGIYAGTGPKDVAELMPVLCDEIAKIKHDGATEEELMRVKSQIKASLLMGQESMMRRADTIAKTLLHKDKVYDQNEIITKIDALTLDDIRNAAVRTLSGAPTLSAIGPLDHLLTHSDLAARLQAA
ncbi:MAG: peptidase M16 [Alphaproteobacteria bacterium]|nr:peptidase M16 [Alphaproteobacteria bacterium]|tara:strand:+ start:13975 stop:15249 length:1275 start_codon:yes stop_codon:yes gene_type:complete